MNALLLRVYQALQPLPCAVTRAWPQTRVPLPQAAFHVVSAAPCARGTRCELGLEARALTPEQADALAAQALAALAAIGFALADWRDGQVQDAACFTVTLRLYGAFAPDGAPAPAPQVTLGEGVPLGGLTALEPLTRGRAFADVTQAGDSVLRFAPQPVDPGAVVVHARLLPQDPGQALLWAALDAGTRITVTVTDPPMAPVTAQGYVAQMTAEGPALTARIQRTG